MFEVQAKCRKYGKCDQYLGCVANEVQLAGIVEWTKADLDVTDRKTSKLMTMYGMLHVYPRSNVSRLYLLRSEGRRGLLSVADSINIERMRSLQCHVSSTQEKIVEGCAEIHQGRRVRSKGVTRIKEEKKEHEIGRKNHFKADS